MTFFIVHYNDWCGQYALTLMIQQLCHWFDFKHMKRHTKQISTSYRKGCFCCCCVIRLIGTFYATTVLIEKPYSWLCGHKNQWGLMGLTNDFLRVLALNFFREKTVIVNPIRLQLQIDDCSCELNLNRKTTAKNGSACCVPCAKFVDSVVLWLTSIPLRSRTKTLKTIFSKRQNTILYENLICLLNH